MIKNTKISYDSVIPKCTISQINCMRGKYSWEK